MRELVRIHKDAAATVLGKIMADLKKEAGYNGVVEISMPGSGQFVSVYANTVLAGKSVCFPLFDGRMDVPEWMMQWACHTYMTELARQFAGFVIGGNDPRQYPGTKSELEDCLHLLGRVPESDADGLRARLEMLFARDAKWERHRTAIMGAIGKAAQEQDDPEWDEDWEDEPVDELLGAQMAV